MIVSRADVEVQADGLPSDEDRAWWEAQNSGGWPVDPAFAGSAGRGWLRIEPLPWYRPGGGADSEWTADRVAAYGAVEGLAAAHEVERRDAFLGQPEWEDA